MIRAMRDHISYHVHHRRQVLARTVGSIGAFGTFGAVGAFSGGAFATAAVPQRAAAAAVQERAAAAAVRERAAAAALGAGRCVAVFRHALAPGTFDPPGFVLTDCSTQRNLSDEGREQARRLGAWFVGQRLAPAAVRSSPWCRCLETARLAFGAAAVEGWAALGSPVRSAAEERQRQVQTLKAALRVASGAAHSGHFEVWVTHQFVVSDLAGVALDSSAGLVLRLEPGAAAAVQVLARLDTA
jgi:phosphohistidine phosphatase SixA